MDSETMRTVLLVLVMCVGLPLFVLRIKIRNIKIDLASNAFWMLISFAYMLLDFEAGNSFAYVWVLLLGLNAYSTVLVSRRLFKEKE